MTSAARQKSSRQPHREHRAIGTSAAGSLSSRSCRLVEALVVCALLARAPHARADEATDVEKGTTSYDAGRYAEGAERFHQMLDPANPNSLKDPKKIQRARAYYAACLIAMKRIDEAKEQIERIYRQEPMYMPDPVVFPGEVLDLFADSRQRFKEQILKESQLHADGAKKAQQEVDDYVAKLRALASSETTVVRHQRWMAVIPFGVGQFQNGQDGLGYTFLISEIVAAGLSLGSAGVILALSADGTSRLRAGSPNVEWADLNDRLETAHTINLCSNIALAALALGGIVHAQLTFVPEVREQRTRTLPQPPRIVPDVSVLPNRFSVGLSGRF